MILFLNWQRIRDSKNFETIRNGGENQKYFLDHIYLLRTNGSETESE